MPPAQAPSKSIACCCRVSSAGQQYDSQRSEIRRWLRGNGIEASAVEWFEDKETGKSLQRPEFSRLEQEVFAGSIKTVVVWKLDRISRHQLDGISVLADWCERGVRVVSITQLIDLRGVVGRMVASVLFGITEIELEYRRERQAAGIRVAKKRGVYRGRKKGTKAAPTRALELRQRAPTVPLGVCGSGNRVGTVSPPLARPILLNPEETTSSCKRNAERVAHSWFRRGCLAILRGPFIRTSAMTHRGRGFSPGERLFRCNCASVKLVPPATMAEATPVRLTPSHSGPRKHRYRPFAALWLQPLQ